MEGEINLEKALSLYKNKDTILNEGVTTISKFIDDYKISSSYSVYDYLASILERDYSGDLYPNLEYYFKKDLIKILNTNESGGKFKLDLYDSKRRYIELIQFMVVEFITILHIQSIDIQYLTKEEEENVIDDIISLF